MLCFRAKVHRANADRLHAIKSTTNLLADDWRPCGYAATLEGGLQSGPLMGTGGPVTILVEPDTLPRFYELNVAR